ncbi:MAG: MATE family efflux transporter [Bacteroidales bacterium]
MLSQLLKKPVWTDIREAIRGTEADYTSIRLNKAILLLAIPMILELVMESTFAVVDIFFVAKLGSSAVAAVGLTETYMYLLYSVGMGLSMGVTAVVARRIGEKNSDLAGRSAVQAVFLGFLCSIPFTFAGIFFSKELLALMGADQWVLEEGYRYMQWMLGGNLVIVLLFVINSVFRGAGDAAIAMRILLISNTANIVLDPLLIFGLGPVPALGIEGAAIATNIGRAAGVIAQFWLLFRGGKHIRINNSMIVPDMKIMFTVLRTSLGGIGQNLVAMMSWIFLMRILSGISSEAVAGSTIALRIMGFTLLPAWGISNAAATLVGQNLGAGNPGRAESSVWKIGVYNMIFLLGISVVFFLFSQPLIEIFTKDETVIKIGGTWLRILSYSYFVYGWWMVTTQAFNGSGDTRTPTKINLVFFWLIEIPLSYWLAIILDWGYTGVFWGVFFAETSAGLASLWLFKRGKWKTVKV